MKNKLIFWIIILYSFSFSVASENLKFTKIINLDYPWGSTFINDNELLISEKNGKIKLINLNTKEINEIEHNLHFSSYGQGGLLDIIYKIYFLCIKNCFCN